MNWPRIIRRAVLVALLLGASPAALRAQTFARNDFSGNYQAQRLSLTVKLSDVMGTMVWDQQGHRIGRIEDLLVDPDSWRVLCALIRPVNLYGPKEYFIGIPAKCFVTVDPDRAVVDATVTNAIGLPRFRAEGVWDAAAMSASLKPMFERFGQKIYWDEKKGLPRLVRCAVWMDMDVTDGSDVNVGRLADFVVDLPAQRVVFTAIAFFGSDANTHVVPPAALSVAPDGGSLVLPMDPARKLSLLNPDDFQWVKITDPVWVAAVYRAYGQQIDLEHGPVLDNAIVRSRDEPLTEIPTDLPVPSSMPRVFVAAPPENLPRAIMTAFIQEDLGNFKAAQNIKVTVLDGNVTLTGRVDNEAQRQSLLSIAQRLAGVGKVTSQLEAR